jgi:hypothetical protein
MDLYQNGIFKSLQILTIKLQPTLVLPIVGLDFETISSGNSVVLRFGT